jgi:hypothetical protein
LQKNHEKLAIPCQPHFPPASRAVQLQKAWIVNG